MTESWLTVYRLQACPYCERVIRVLDELELPYHSRFVEPMHSERNVVKRLTGSRSVPALVDDRNDVILSESENIVNYLRGVYGNGN